jgi:hypothetical protein
LAAAAIETAFVAPGAAGGEESVIPPTALVEAVGAGCNACESDAIRWSPCPGAAGAAGGVGTAGPGLESVADCPIAAVSDAAVGTVAVEVATTVAASGSGPGMLDVMSDVLSVSDWLGVGCEAGAAAAGRGWPWLASDAISPGSELLCGRLAAADEVSAAPVVADAVGP